MKALTNLLILFALMTFTFVAEARDIFALEDLSLTTASGSDIIINGSEVHVNGKLIVLSTTEGAVACPVMTETQRDAISTPIEGDCVFNSDTSALNIYDGASWASVGTTVYSNPNPLFANTERFGGGTTNALATGATAFGTNAVASGSDSVTMGYDAQSLGGQSVAIGHDSDSIGVNSTSIGFNSTATGANSVALGAGANVTATDGIAIGLSANANVGSVAIGWSAANTGQLGVTIGRNNDTTFDRVVSVGGNALAGALNAISIGYNADTTGANTIVIGADSNAGVYTDSILIGEGLSGSASDEINIGDTITGDLSAGAIAIAGPLSAGQFSTGGLPTASSYDGYLAYDTTLNALVISDGAAWGAVGAGDFVGPVSASDTAVMLFDGTTGKLAKNSNVLIDSDGRMDFTGLGGSVFLGNLAGAVDDLSANNNVGIGLQSLTAVTSGHSNTAIGGLTMRSTVTGNQNVALGYFAGDAITGSHNIAIGYLALSGVGSGNSNTGVGVNAISSNLAGARNTGVGHGALQGTVATTNSDNTGLGYFAGNGLSTGASNIFIGRSAGVATTTGSFNILIGNLVEASGAGASSELNIGDTITGDVSLGDVTIANDLSITNLLLPLGRMEFPNMDTSLHIGENSGLADDFTDNKNTSFGQISYVSGTGTENTTLGYKAGNALVGGNNNTYVGSEAGMSNITGPNNTAVGRWALNLGTGNSNTAIGTLAIQNNTGNSNVAIGNSTLSGVGAGGSNVAIGSATGQSNTSGARNVYIGASAANLATTGSDNIIIGHNVALPAAGDNNYLSIDGAITGDLATGDITIANDLFVTGSLIVSGSDNISDLDVWYQDNFTVNKSSFFSVTGDDATPDNAGTGTMSGSLTTRTGASAMNGIHDNGFLSDGAGTNDFFLSDVIPVTEVAVSQTATFSFYYEWNGADDDMSFIVLDSTNDTVISHATNHDLKVTTEPTRFYATIDIPSTTRLIRYGFQRNASTLKTLYFTNLTFKTPLMELFQTKYLASDATSTADLTDLTFNNLTIGRTYRVSGFVYATSTDDANDISVFSASAGGGTQYGRIYQNWDTDDTGFTTTVGSGVYLQFTALSADAYIRLTAPFGALIAGDGTSRETYITLTELVDVAETDKF